jgi:hypothetical protein
MINRNSCHDAIVPHARMGCQDSANSQPIAGISAQLPRLIWRKVRWFLLEPHEPGRDVSRCALGNGDLIGADGHYSRPGEGHAPEPTRGAAQNDVDVACGWGKLSAPRCPPPMPFKLASGPQSTQSSAPRRSGKTTRAGCGRLLTGVACKASRGRKAEL